MTRLAALALLALAACRHPAWVGQPPGAEDAFADCAPALLTQCPRRTRARCMMGLAGDYRAAADKPTWLAAHGCAETADADQGPVD